jgi:chromate transport protein ChrA
VAVPIGLLLVLLPGSLAMLVLCLWYSGGVAQTPAVELALKGLGAAAAALVVVTVLRVLRSGSVDRTALVIAGFAFVALGPLSASLFVVAPPLLVVAIWLERPRATAAAKAGEPPRP